MAIFFGLGPAFGTFKTSKEDIIYGVDTHMKVEEHNHLQNLLKIPFQNSAPRKVYTIK
jgi:hypothetical protein